MKESQHLEWKTSWRDEYLKWLCGFANAQGGTLEVGRNDRGEVVGLRDPLRLLMDIPAKARALLGIVVDVNLKAKGAKEYLQVVVNPSSTPISYKGEYHYRSGSTKQVLRGAALNQFLLEKHGRHWDEVPVTRVTVQDLDQRELNNFKNRAVHSERLAGAVLGESDSTLIDKLRLREREHLRRAAVLLFHPDPERFVTGAIVKIGYFRSESELAYQDVIEGTLFTQVDRTVDLLRTKYSKAEVAYSGLYRTETPPVPSEALREAVVNAIAHKDYASPAPIQIRAYDDRLEVWNPGHLPQGWTVDHLTSRHPSIPFNPLIANAFFRAGMIEAWGRGIQRIMDVCETSKVPVPKWRYESGGLRVEFATRHSPRRIESQVTRETNRGHAGPSPGPSGPYRGAEPGHGGGHAGPSPGPSGPYRQAEPGHGGRERHRGELKPTSAVGPAGTAIGREDTASSHYKPSEGETRLLLACVSQPSSARQLLAAAGYEKRAGNFRRKLQQLLDRGLLERTVSIPRSPKQKYRITDTGKAALAIAGDQRDAG